MQKINRKKIQLKKLINQANTIILAWSGTQRIKKDSYLDMAHLPPLYQVMAYQGEAILLERFFGCIRNKIGIEINHQDYLDFYRHSVLDSGFLLDFISRSEWLRVLQVNALHINYAQAKTLYCIFLAVVAERSPDKLGLVCDDFFIHLYRQQFPEETSNAKTTATDQLRHKLTHKLRRIKNLPCEIKESFVQNDDKVTFTLLYRDDNKSPYRPLITLERPRLKSARITAYETLLNADDLENILNGRAMLKSYHKKVVHLKEQNNS